MNERRRVMDDSYRAAMDKPREFLEYWQLVNSDGEVLQVHSLRGVFHKDKDVIIQVVEKSHADKLESEVKAYKAATENLNKALEYRESLLQEALAALDSYRNGSAFDFDWNGHFDGMLSRVTASRAADSIRAKLKETNDL